METSGLSWGRTGKRVWMDVRAWACVCMREKKGGSTRDVDTPIQTVCSSSFPPELSISSIFSAGRMLPETNFALSEVPRGSTFPLRFNALLSATHRWEASVLNFSSVFQVGLQDSEPQRDVLLSLSASVRGRMLPLQYAWVSSWILKVVYSVKVCILIIKSYFLFCISWISPIKT